MRSRIVAGFFALFFVVPVMFAGAEKATYEQALKSGGKDGAVIYLYGPDWEKRGEKLMTTVFKNKNVRNACGKAGLVAIPVYQRPDEKERKKAESIGKGFKATRAIRSYPALVLRGADEKDYYTICGDEILKSPDEIAALMKEKFELYKQRCEIMKKAANAKGVALAKVYAEACNIEGIYRLPDAEKIIRANDPGLKEDVCARALFDVFSLITDRTHPSSDKKGPEVKIYTNEEVLARLKELTTGDRYTPRQKQEVYLAATGLLRRNGYNEKELRRLWSELVELDPTSVSAKYAMNAAEIYTGAPLPKPKKKADDGASEKKTKH
ncbi:MAG: hypothetical protein K6B46_02285 [Opitutales bacterium]|nr:hypothetical protein [Opitutales bacterium]